jgi:hypothetical protein
LSGKKYHEGDFISIDGTTGRIYDGLIPTVDATIAGEFGRIMAWADNIANCVSVQTLIHLQMPGKPVNWALKESAFAVQSICSLSRKGSLHSVK